MRVLVIGASGTLGSELMLAFDGDAIGLDHAAIELTAPDSIARALAQHAPDVAINTAAFHNLEACEADPHRAFAVNALGVDHLAGACAAAGVHLVHLSTDYVFDGSARTPYDETAAVGPLNVYAISKVAGERLVGRHGGAWTIVRTSGLYGTRGKSSKGTPFVERMLAQAAEGRPLHVVDDVTFSPSYAPQVAATIRALVERGERGIVHVANDGACTWYEFAREIFRQATVEADLHRASSDRFPGAARRPAYSALACNALVRAGIGPLGAWREGLRAYLRERTAGAPT